MSRLFDSLEEIIIGIGNIRYTGSLRYMSFIFTINTVQIVIKIKNIILINILFLNSLDNRTINAGITK